MMMVAPSLRLRLPLRGRWLSTQRSAALNLTPIASPLLLRLHPDRLQRLARRHPAAAAANEDALKQLNQFLEIATFGCNNDGYRARKQILSLAAEQHGSTDAPIRWLLQFHVEQENELGDQDASALTQVDHIIEVPTALVRRTLAHGARLSGSDAMTAAPFAREWQRTTKTVLRRLFDAAQIQLYHENDEGVKKPSQLAQWLEEDETKETQRERGVATHNAAAHKMHRDFDKLFVGMLAKEKGIVHLTTTGLEDGPTTQHAILSKLVAQRLFLEKIADRDEKRRVFFWLANILLMNFMELRLHALVWNKVVLMVTKDEALESPQVLWASETPEEGMAVLIPADMDAYTLVDVLYEHVEELERALNENAKRKASHARRQQQRENPGQSPRRKKKHFYADEVAAMYRKR